MQAQARQAYALLWCSQDTRIDYRDEMVQAFRGEGEHWDVIDIFAQDFPENARGYAGYVVSGSEYSVNDQEPWVERLFAFIREQFEAGIPLVGICFGAQAVAKALGGRVANNPRAGFLFNVEPIEPLPPLRDWLSARGEPAPRLIESHGECVVELPAGAQLLARSANTEVEAYRLGARVLGIQGHPEISPATALNDFLPVHRAVGHTSAEEAEQLQSSLREPLAPRGMLALSREVLTGRGLDELNEA